MAPSRSRSKSQNRRAPLEEDILNTGRLKTTSKKRKAIPEQEDAGYVDSKSSKKILKIGQDLAEEEQRENLATAPNPAFAFESRFGEGDESVEGDIRHDDEDTWGEEEEDLVEDAEIDPNDADMFNRFMPSSSVIEQIPEQEEDGQTGNRLTDLILERIAAHEAAQGGERVYQGGGAPEDAVEIPAKVVEVYSKYLSQHIPHLRISVDMIIDRIAILMSRYKSGALPKPFKILPSTPHWETLLEITKPEKWTPNACFQATRIFVSTKPHITQLFLHNVLLDHVREDIHETKKLNVHYFNSLKKALYKPAAFFKGFLFPLLTEGNCTLREATIISAVLVRVSIPVLHSAAALLRLTEIAAEQTSISSSESAGATNIFIRVLLEKKYALPYKVIDGLVFHFLRFRATMTAEGKADGSHLAAKEAALPLLWHRSLLAFAQRYRNDITEDQREALLDLILTRGHKDIGPEVRRELLEGRGRGVIVQEPVDFEGDDTMRDVQ